MSDDLILDTPVAPAKKRRGRQPRAAAPEQGSGLSPDQFQQLLTVLAQSRTDGGMNLTELKEVLSATSLGAAQAMQKAMKPENEAHAGKSCFSYAEGDLAKPRPVLPYQCFYNNYPMHMFPETEHWRELELASELQPGEFTVMRKDFTVMKVIVKGERDAHGRLTRVDVEFPISREDKWKIPPKVAVLYQLVYPDSPKRRFVEGMNEFMQIALPPEPVGA